MTKILQEDVVNDCKTTNAEVIKKMTQMDDSKPRPLYDPSPSS
jgi:hypothetical protein